MKVLSKKISAVLLSFLLFVMCLNFPNCIKLESYAVSDSATAHKYALQLVAQHEGSYTSVNKNDNGALSIGKLQWHAGNAKELLKKIINKNTSQASSILGSSLYNEILSSTSWQYRTVTDSEASILKTFLATSESKTVQDAEESSWIMDYINNGLALGLNDNAVLVYYADMANQGKPFANCVASKAKDVAGTYAEITLDIIHKVALEDQNEHFYSQYWNSNVTRRNNSYKFCQSVPSDSGDPTIYESMPSGTISLKNKSTGTYMTVNGGKASNGQNISVAAKTSSDAFKFNISGGTSNYLASKLNTSYVVNPYSDTPGNGTNITLYTKNSSGTQTWKFESVSGGYIIHSGYNGSCVLTVDGTNVKLATKTGKDNQIWVIDGIETYTSMSSGDIWLKNKSTGSYMTVDDGKASNGQNISVASKTSSNAFIFTISGGTSNYLASKLNTSYVVNPYSDTPGNGTNITLYTKDSTGTQTWKFEVVSGGYIIHSGYNESCVLTVDGTNVKLATKTGKDNQIWSAEKVTYATNTTTSAATTKTTTTTTTTTVIKPELSIDISELTLLVGEQYTIKANQNNLTYKSSNMDTAVVNKSGVITAVSSGKLL